MDKWKRLGTDCENSKVCVGFRVIESPSPPSLSSLAFALLDKRGSFLGPLSDAVIPSSLCEMLDRLLAKDGALSAETVDLVSEILSVRHSSSLIPLGDSQRLTFTARTNGGGAAATTLKSRMRPMSAAPEKSFQDKTETMHSGTTSVTKRTIRVPFSASLPNPQTLLSMLLPVARPKGSNTGVPIPKQVQIDGILRIFVCYNRGDMRLEMESLRRESVKLVHYGRSKGIEVVFVDLRYGLTDEETDTFKDLFRCFEYIRRCTYFIGVLGARYGCVAKACDKNDSGSDISSQYSVMDDLEGLSHTEYQIQLATLHSDKCASRGFFYLRDDDAFLRNEANEDVRRFYVAESVEDKARMKSLRDKIKASIHYREYASIEAFMDHIMGDLYEALDEDFTSIGDLEESAHIRHITAHTRGFKGRQDTLSSLRSEIEKSVSQEETPVIMVIGEHGIGKSAVMAALYSDMIEAPSKIQHAIVHFVGASHESFRIENISKRFWGFLTTRTNAQESNVGAREKSQYLNGLHSLFQEHPKMLSPNQFVFMIDGVDRVRDSVSFPKPSLLDWIPQTTPINTSLVISATTHTEAHQIGLQKDFTVVQIDALQEDEVLKATEEYFKNRNKELSSEYAESIQQRSPATCKLYSTGKLRESHFA